MSTVLDEVLSANAAYAASFGEKADLPMPPRRKFAILTCMDARMDPARFLGLAEGDANVIRNGGGRASDDAIRSLVISSKLLGTREWFVVHHTDCATERVTDEQMEELLAHSLEAAEVTAQGYREVGAGPGSLEGRFMDWLTISNRAQAVIDDVTRIRHHPLVPRSIPIYGYVYDVKTGLLNEIEAAMKAGSPK